MEETGIGKLCHKDILKYLDTEALLKYGTVQYYNVGLEETQKEKKPRAQVVRCFSNVFDAYLGKNGVVLDSCCTDDVRRFFNNKPKPEIIKSDVELDRIYIDKDGVHVIDRKAFDQDLQDTMDFTIGAARRRRSALKEEERRAKQHIRNFLRKLLFKEEEKMLPELHTTFLAPEEIDALLANVAHENFALKDFYIEQTKDKKVNENFIKEYEKKKENNIKQEKKQQEVKE